MKKTLIALAAVAVAGAASAQVTLSGYVAFGVQSTGADASTTTTDNSLKVTASEDLGGGMKITAATQFALGANRGDGATIKKEDTSLALATDAGTLSIANSRSSNASVRAIGLSGASLVNDQYTTLSPRVNIDVISFTLPKFDRLTATVQYLQRAGDTSTATNADNLTSALDLSYAVNQDLTLGVTLKKNSGNSEAAQNEFSASYNAGFAKVAYGYTKAEGSDSLSGFGVSVPVGAMTLGASYGKTGSVKYYDVAAVYNLSKTTNVNASFGRHNSDADTQYRVKLIKNF